ncbi:PH domain-containing protein [Parvimonas sp. D9]|uniref:PH domain-containing protein n=1 Tax=Parvimonas sp. D9 TaxID=3110689 RepID=UPI002B489F43|nr:PH domain-containing protein [Parvimonas sp. D9]MEB3059044.1 PH domain-containing protein [Parvimonas sp. D9]
MAYDLILIGCLWMVFAISYFSQKKGFSYNNGKILLTTIPINEVDSEEVQEISKKGLKSFKLLNLVFFILSFSLLFTNTDIEIILLLGILFVYLISIGVLSNKYIKQMRKLKKEKKFASFTRKYVDLSVSKEIDKQKLPIFVWLIPFVVFIGGFSIFGTFSDMELILFICLSTTLIAMIFMGLFWRRSKISVISDNKEKNLYINKIKIIKLQNKIFTLVNVYSVLFLVLIYLQKMDKYSFIPFIVSIILITFFIFYIISTVNKIDKEISSNIEDDKFIEDQDEYYDIFGYKNPNDPRLLVSDPMNTGNTVINRGNKKGKILFAFTNVIVAITIIFSLTLIFEEDWKVEISDTVKISTMLYKENIKQSDIENLELLDKFPNKRAVRMNGGATKEKAYGNFSIEGEGNVRLYVFKKTDKVIKISRKNQKTIYINMRTNEETEDLYEKLKNFVDK